MRRYQPRTEHAVGPTAAMVSAWGRPGIIKSIQRGTTTIGSGGTSATTTITAVVVANSVIHWLGNTSDDAGATVNIGKTRVELTNATTVTAFVGLSGSNPVVSWEVIEYFPGVIKSVQRGTVVPGTPVTITTVNTAKATCEELGWTSAGGTTNQGSVSYLALTNATTVTATGTGTACTCGYQVTEWY